MTNHHEECAYIFERSQAIRDKDIQANLKLKQQCNKALLVGGLSLICLYPLNFFWNKPLKAEAHLSNSCSMANFWMDEYNQKNCTIVNKLETGISLTPLISEEIEKPVQPKKFKQPATTQEHTDPLSIPSKNFWSSNPYKNKQSHSIPKAAWRKQKIKWKWRKEINYAHKKTGVPKNLIAAIIVQESAGNPKAVSHCGAKGLMQLMPATAKRFGCNDAFNPKQNILAGSKYVAWLDKKFRGNKTKVIASYNAGEGNVIKYKGIPPFKETQYYVPAVKLHETHLAMLGE